MTDRARGPLATVSTPAMRIRPCGDAAILVEVDDLATVIRLAAAVDAARADGGPDGGLTGVVDVVPAARTVLLRCRGAGDLRPVARALRQLSVPDETPTVGDTVRIRVVYDGEDLAEVAELTGLEREQVIARHQATEWRVAFTGFAPGFGYLEGGDGSLDVRRRAESRPRVPAGAVGLAGEFTGVYPRSSPGGWQLIGHTDAVLWDPRRSTPALLTPGTRVRFEEADR